VARPPPCPRPLPYTTLFRSYLVAAGNDLRHHLALRHGAMGQHRLAGHVADGVDAAHGGAAALVNPDETPIHIQPDFAQAPAIGRSEEHTSELQSRENLVCRL